MEIKGTAVKTIPAMVKDHFADEYDEWLQALSPEAYQIFSDVILANKWYPLKDAAIEPSIAIGKMFYNDENKGGWECGRYSAELALKGIYKVFIKISSASYIIDRASKIFTTYYNPSEMQIKNKRPNGVDLHITKFPEPHSVIEARIAGWIERALEINNCKNVIVEIGESMASGDDKTIIYAKWE